MNVSRSSLMPLLRFALLISYMALTATLALFHEPWRDEADTWLMARDSSLSTIASIVPNMGTPIGWYLILKPFAALGLPFGTQQVLALLLVWSAAAVIIFQGPFSIAVSASLCLSWFLSFEYSVIARNYAVGVAGVFYLLGSWSSRGPARLRTLQWWLSWPLITFSSVHFLALTPGLMLLSTIRSRPGSQPRPLPSVAVLWPLALFVVATWSLWPTGSGQLSPNLLAFFKPLNLVQAISLSVFSFGRHEGAWAYAGCALFLLLLFLCKPRPWEILALTLMILGLNAIFVCKYFFLLARYAGLNWLILIVAAWLSLGRSEYNELPLATKLRLRSLSWLLVAITFANLPSSTSRWHKEITRPFTDAEKTAQYLLENDLLQERIACSKPPQCSAVLGYLPAGTKFWYPGIGNWGTHMMWDDLYAKSLKLTPEEALLRAREFLHDSAGHQSFLFLTNRPIAEPESLGLSPVAPQPHGAWFSTDEGFTIYRWNADAP